MAPISSIPGTLAPAEAAGQPPAVENIEDAARQFEALLVEQMLRTMRESGGEGWMGTGEDKSAESLMGYAEQEISRVIAASGGFGLAKMVSAGLTPRSDEKPMQPGLRTDPSR